MRYPDLKPIAPPEDLSWMNPRHSKRAQEAARKAQDERIARDPAAVKAQLAANGKRNAGKARVKH